MVSGSADGSICLWGTKDCESKYRYKCIAKIYHTKAAKKNSEGKSYAAITEKLCSVNSFAISIDEKEGIPIDSHVAEDIKHYNSKGQQYQDLTSLIDDQSEQDKQSPKH